MKIALIALATSTVFAFTLNGVQAQTPTTTPTTTAPIPVTPISTEPIVNPTPAPEDLGMLQSEEALRTYALEQSSKVGASIYAPLSVGDNANSYVALSENSVAGIISTVKAMSLSVDVPNPKDFLCTWVGVYDASGNILFTGTKSYYLVPSGSSYVMPPDYGDVVLEMCEDIPITISGAQSAMVDILGSDGRTTSEYSLNIWNNKVFIPRKLCGTNAIIAVWTGDPNESIPVGSSVGSNRGWIYWNIGNGKWIQPTHFGVNLNPSVKGIASFLDQNVYVPVTTSNGVGNNMTAELKATKIGWSTYSVSFWTTEGKWCKSAWVRKTGEKNWVQYTPHFEAVHGMMSFSLLVQPGVYYIIPVWNNGDLVEPFDPWTPPYGNGGGKG